MRFIQIPQFPAYKKIRRRWDSNPRYAYHIYTLSKRAPSAARTLLHEGPKTPEFWTYVHTIDTIKGRQGYFSTLKINLQSEFSTRQKKYFRVKCWQNLCGGQKQVNNLSLEFISFILRNFPLSSPPCLP